MMPAGDLEAPAQRLDARPAAAPPPKVVHVVENLHHGAVESWLVRMLAHARDHGVATDWTIYCALPRAGRQDERARALGARVIHSPVPIGEKAAFVGALRAALQRERCDVLHCHHDLVRAVYLAAAIGTPVRTRIVHVHNADESVLTPSRLKQALLKEPLRHVCLRLADRIAANSNHTLDTFLGGRARRPGRDVVHLYGVDPAPFAIAPSDRSAFRRELQIAGDAPLLLFAGRLVAEKNPLFAVDVVAELVRRDPRVVGVFAGSGGDEDAVRARIAALGIGRSTRLLGWRDDVARIMRAADWFILPHPEQPMEGFGLAVVEAQLAGLRLLLSTGIPDDPLLPSARQRRLPLSAGAATWAEAALALAQEPSPSAARALADLAASPMNMHRALAGLCALHAAASSAHEPLAWPVPRKSP
jgi:glycosyltransferase involved in cell wall biosynthesis